MRLSISICLLVVIALNSHCTAPRELTDDDFQSYIDSHDIVMVKFYAPWCGHCKAFAPEYEKAVDIGEKHIPPFYLVNVDATVQKKLAETYEIQGFPTVKLFLKGRKPINYEGERKADAVIKFIEKKSGPVSNEILSIEDFLKEQKANDVIVVFGGDSNSQEFKEYLNGVSSYDDIKFFHTTIQILKEGIEKENAKKEEKEDKVNNENGKIPQISELTKSSIVLFKNFDEKIDIFSESFESGLISQFIEKNFLPIVLPINQKTVQAVFSKGAEAMFLFMDSNKADSASISTNYAQFAKDNKGKFMFFKAGIKGDLESRFAEFLKIKDKDLPRLEIFKPDQADIARYLFNQIDFTYNSFAQFLKDFRGNKIERYFKSEEIPIRQESAVVKIVGKSWKNLVLDSKKDIFVKFYAPWCVHCKELAPKYVELAEKLKNFDNLMIAEVDATENDIPGISVRSFPTLKFFPSQSKHNPIDYSGDRNVDAMLKFIKEKSSTPIEVAGDEPEENARVDL